MKSSVKAKLRKRANKNGKHTVIIQVIIDRASTEISSNVQVDKGQWDDNKRKVKKHPRFDLLNYEISTKINQIEEVIFESLREGKTLLISDVKKTLLTNRVKKPESTKETFSSYFKRYIDTNPDQLGIATIKYHKTALKNWNCIFPKLRVNELKESHMIEYRKYLFEKLDNSVNTVCKKMKTLRKMCGKLYRANKTDRYLFENITLKQEEGQRGYLLLEELKLIEDLELTNDREILSRDIFLFSSFCGLRFSDICKLKPQNVVTGGKGKVRLKLRMQKTSENLEFNLNKRAISILEKYLSMNGKYVFPMLKKVVKDNDEEVKKKIGSANAWTNKLLKELFLRAEITKENLSMHSGRHSFAIISIEKGADLYVISKMLGHKSITTTEIYAKLVDKRKDELVNLWDNE